MRPRLALALSCVSLACGGSAPAVTHHGPTTRIQIASTGDALADAKTYLAKVCPTPIGGELNFMVWEGYTDTLFTAPFERACGVKVNATYMGSSDDLVAKLRAGGAQTVDLISPSSDAVTAIIQAGLASPLDLSRIPTYAELSASFRALPLAKKDGQTYGLPWAFGPNPLIYDTTKVHPTPTSWSVLWEPAYRGKISLQDDIATLYMVAQYLGMDDPNDKAKLYNLSDADLAKVKAKMLELKPH